MKLYGIFARLFLKPLYGLTPLLNLLFSTVAGLVELVFLDSSISLHLSFNSFCFRGFNASYGDFTSNEAKKFGWDISLFLLSRWFSGRIDCRTLAESCTFLVTHLPSNLSFTISSWGKKVWDWTIGIYFGTF